MNVISPHLASSPPAILWLRAAVTLSALSQAWWLGGVKETPLLEWLASPEDVGGLNLGEKIGLRVQGVVAALLLLAAPGLWIRWGRWVLAPLALFQLTIALAMWQKNAGFPLDLAWLGDGDWHQWSYFLAGLFPFISQAARIAAPAVLLLLEFGGSRAAQARRYSPGAEWLARVAIGLTFIAHGIEALQHYPAFIDMLLIGLGNLGWESLSEQMATQMLTVIGAIDVVVGVLIIAVRARPVAGYMAFWGLVTAIARIVAYGWENGWYECGVRMVHVGLPLALLVWWSQHREGSKVIQSGEDSRPERGA